VILRVLCGSFFLPLLVDELASARGGGYVAAVNCVMTVGAPVDQGKTRAVVVRRVTLQAERWLAHGQQILVGRTVRGMTLEATLGHRGVLEGKRPLILGMAAETKLVSVRDLQIVARAAAMRIMTIDAGHLAFANRVVVGQIGFGTLLLVATQALVVHLATRLDRSWSGLGLALKCVAAFAMRLAMNGVAVAALDVLGLVSAGEPVAHVIGLGVATEAGAVGLLRLAVFEADDLVLRLFRVATGREVQASRTVTLLTVDFAQRV